MVWYVRQFLTSDLRYVGCNQRILFYFLVGCNSKVNRIEPLSPRLPYNMATHHERQSDGLLLFVKCSGMLCGGEDPHCCFA